MDAVFYRADRYLKLFGNLVVLKTPEVHEERSFIHLIQLLESQLNVLHCQFSESSILCQAVAGVYVVQIFCSIDEGVSPHHPLVIGDEGVLHNGV